MPCDRRRGVDRLLERGAREIRRAGMTAAHFGPITQVHRDADRAVAVVLDGVGAALAHRDREPVALRHVAVAGARAGAARAFQRRMREAIQLCALAAETVALR